MTPELGPPIEVLHPDSGAAPLVISSPHSGQIYPPSLLSELRVPVEQLRCLEDGGVDRLFGAAPGIGAPLLRARFARAYVDPNREAFELDAALFDGLPTYVNAGSVEPRAGLGTIPSRIGGEGDLSLAPRLRRGRAADPPRLLAVSPGVAGPVRSRPSRVRRGAAAGLPLDAELRGRRRGGERRRHRLRAGRSVRPGLRAAGDRPGRGDAAAPRLSGRAQPALRRRPHHGPLWPAGDRRPRPADRAPPRPVHGGAARASRIRPWRVSRRCCASCSSISAVHGRASISGPMAPGWLRTASSGFEPNERVPSLVRRTADSSGLATAGGHPRSRPRDEHRSAQPIGNRALAMIGGCWLAPSSRSLAARRLCSWRSR